MSQLKISLLLLTCLLGLGSVGGAAEYYVAPQGDDTALGNKLAPFATIQKAQAVAQPGDTVWLFGGIYHLTEAHITKTKGLYASVIYLDKSGSADLPIRYWALPGERPVFDFSQITLTNNRVIGFHVTGSWLHLRGFDVTGVQVGMTGHTQSESFENQGSYNIYEHLSMHDSQAIGFYLTAGSHNLIINCDAYNNYDFTSENGKGGNTDGFGCHPRKGAVGNVFRGCRAWFNSDDGYDSITASESVLYENCWAFYNGYDPEFKSLADGNGFKVGGWAHTPIERLPHPMPRHAVHFCLAVRNKASGFYANHHLVGSDWINNTAYRNSTNFNMLARTNDPDGIHFDMEVPGFDHVLKNNLGFKGRREVTNINAERCDVTYNYFTLPVTVSEQDFISLDESQLTLPRKNDGSLPDITLLHLAPGSVLIGAGFDTITKSPSATADLGCFPVLKFER